jgi:hypothetical protein
LELVDLAESEINEQYDSVVRVGRKSDLSFQRDRFHQSIRFAVKRNILWEKMMGLFDFAKSIGRKLFDKESDAAEKIRAHIEQDNPGIKDLKVAYNDGVVSLSGSTDDPEAMEKAVLMAGNVSGVAEVQADELEAPEAVEQVEYYVIEKGDTLSAIAKKYYGKASDYPRIFEANREVIKDPDLIFPGQKIRIPLF